MTMKRAFLTIAALLTSVSGVLADDADRFKWDGAMSVESETAQCGGQFVTQDGVQARLHPKLDADQPFSSFTRFDGTGETVMVQKESDGQFNGTGDYELYRIFGGQFSETNYSSNQTYNLTQAPATITSATVFVTLSGTLSNYAGITGCTITVRGTFARVDAED